MVPLRTCQTTPLTSRSRVTRRLTASTVPVASPASMTSPTPYWSSSSMKIPDKKSRTRLCAPKPMARPRTPALASTGARFRPRSPAMVTAAMPKMSTDAALRRIEPRALARCRRRSPSSTASDFPLPPPCATREVILLISRWATIRTSTAISSTKMIRSTALAGWASHTLTSSAALRLCRMSQVSRQAIPGCWPLSAQTESRVSLDAELRARAARSACEITGDSFRHSGEESAGLGGERQRRGPGPLPIVAGGPGWPGHLGAAGAISPKQFGISPCDCDDAGQGERAGCNV